MSDSIVKVVDSSEIETKNVEVGEWGLTFKGQLTPNEWYDVALAIQKFDGKLQWYLGDLAVYAESPTTGWGESKYSELIAGTGYDEGSLRVMASVARRFPLSFRENVLSQDNTFERITFTHFRAVAPLDDNFAFYWLQKAANNAWGVAKLRDEIRKWKESKEEDNEDSDENTKFIPTLSQRIKESWTRIRDIAEEQEAEIIRIQVVKNSKVIHEELIEL